MIMLRAVQFLLISMFFKNTLQTPLRKRASEISLDIDETIAVERMMSPSTKRTTRICRVKRNSRMIVRKTRAQRRSVIPELFVADNRGTGFVGQPIILVVNDVTRVHEFLTSRESERPFRFYLQSEHEDEKRAQFMNLVKGQF